MSVADRLTALRENKGWTKAELAEKSGITVQMIYKYESGESDNLTLASLEKLCKALSVTAYELLGWKSKAELVENTYDIPVYSKIYGYDSIPLSENLVGYTEYKVGDGESADDFFGLVVSGRTFYDMNEDVEFIAVIRRQDRIDNGKFGAVIIDGGDMVVRKVEYYSEITCTALDKNGLKENFVWTDIGSKKFQYIGRCVEIKKKI
ncbi:MAG: helix-turn-helix domain-containing protein [Clostridia bacterium]|nr:helix-turn-helix domain-containing protein [Clostridia bacterium]